MDSEEQIMSKDKCLRISLNSNGHYCVNYPLNIFPKCKVLKTDEYHLDIPQF